MTFKPGLEQGRSHLAVPGRAVDDPLDPVGAVGDLPIDAEVAGPDRGRFLRIAAPAVGVGGVELGDELADDVIHVPSGHGRLDELPVALPHGRPIDAVHVRDRRRSPSRTARRR